MFSGAACAMVKIGEEILMKIGGAVSALK